MIRIWLALVLSAGCYQASFLSECTLTCDGQTGCPGELACGPDGKCHDRGTAACVVPSAIDYVKASNTSGGDQFGTAIALSADGSTLAVGAWREDSDGVDNFQTNDQAPDSGAVYVYAREGASWVQQAYVKASNAAANDLFGWSVALSGDGATLAVGAFGEDSAATGVNGDQGDDTGTNSGAVYVFTRRDGAWTQQAYLKASNTERSMLLDGDEFGFTIALSADGSTLAVAAPQEDSAAVGIGGDQTSNAAADAGTVYVFTRIAGVWTQQAYLKAVNTDPGDLFGYSLALSEDGSSLAVGAFNEASNSSGVNNDPRPNTLLGSGAVYVFLRSDATWTQQAYVKASNPGGGDAFGRSVALTSDGSTLAVGATNEDSNASGIDGDQASDVTSSAGAVYVFTRLGATWTQQAYVKASNPDAMDLFGLTVSLSGDGSMLAVAAVHEASGSSGVDGNQIDSSAGNSGAVYVFARSSTLWSQQAYVKASNTGAGDEFGWSLALAAGGLPLAIGAPREGSSAIGIGGNQADDGAIEAGAVYVFGRTPITGE